MRTVSSSWPTGARTPHHEVGRAGAFFTPFDLALDLALDVTGHRVVDLCAGIGVLAYACARRHRWDEASGAPALQLTCVEVNPDYVRVGRKVLPEATWVVANVLDWAPDVPFDHAVSNPPFGRIPRLGGGPRYRGAEFEYHVADIAGSIARSATLVLPQLSAGFSYSGHAHFEHAPSAKYQRFTAETGLGFTAAIGIDTTCYGRWHAPVPRVEVVRLKRVGAVSRAPSTVDASAA